MFKIQMRLTNERMSHLPPLSEEEMAWRDMVDMPDFFVFGDAEDWLETKGAKRLEKYGFQFRVIPIEVVTV
jgi:hypothetical protein